MSDGLEGVIAADTVLSEVDGEAGRLIVRGRSLDQLAGGTSFEQVTRLLWDGFFEHLPDDLAPALGAARLEVFAEVAALDTGLLDRTPIEGMRALTARLADGDDLAVALRLVAAPAVFTAAVVRAQAGEAPLRPDPALSHAADALRMLRGRPPSHAEAAALDTYLVTVSDHGLNASTFAARVIASTRAGLTSSVLGGISALKGPLHGGAPGPIIEMLDGIGTPQNARAWIEAALDRGDRLMGFGHRVYRAEDPRARVLRRTAQELDAPRYEVAKALEDAALAELRARRPDRVLETNVEFWAAIILDFAQVPADITPAMFTCARTAGWAAHIMEQKLTGRLIRPSARYVGPAPRPVRDVPGAAEIIDRDA